MENNKLAGAKFIIQRFFATVFSGEISKELYKALKEETFLKALREASEEFYSKEMRRGTRILFEFMDKAGLDTHQNLRYEYADLFLNAGNNPVIPYESFYADREPTLYGEQVFQMRDFLRKQGLHKDPNYLEPEDHIAVQFDFLAELNRREQNGDKTVADTRKDFGRRHIAWRTEFCGVLHSADKSGFYKSLAELTLAYLFVAHLASAPLEKVAPLNPAADLVSLGMVLDLLPLARESFLLKPGVIDPHPARTIPTHCYSCGALCGLTAKLKDGVLMTTSGLRGDIKGGGRLCAKGASARHHVYSAYRLKSPLIKESGRFRKASWDEALDKIVADFRALDPSRIGYMRGNDFANWVHEALFDHLGCPKTTHRPMCDNSNRMSNEHNLSDKRPWINYQEADYILHFGMNELVSSYGQRKTTELKAAVARGAKLVVFDPRRSETAALATEWIPIKPSTDAAVTLAMCHVIIKNGLIEKDFVSNWTTGFEAFKNRVMGEDDDSPKTPAWASRISGVPAETIERIALEFAKSTAKGAMSWAGLAQTPNGMYATAALQALNALCGTFDAPGGPSLPFKRKLKSPWGEGQEKPPKGSAPKLNKLRMWSGWAPAYVLDDVESGKLEGMICYFGDPVLSWGNQEAVTEAIKKMKFKVCIDAFMCNTALLCDVVLPDATWLEQSQIKPDWLYEAQISYWAEVVRPLYDSRPMYWITMELAKRMGLGNYFPWKTIEDAFENQLAGLPCTLDQLKKEGYVVTDSASYYKYKKWGSLNPPDGYSSSGHTPTGKYNFVNLVAQEKGVDPLPDFHDGPPDLATDATYPFLFCNFRIFGHEHSSTFFNWSLMKQNGRNTLWINNMDAHDLQIREGEVVRLKSPWGQVEMNCHPTWDIMPGILGAAGGFGHLRGLEGDPKFPQFGGQNAPGIQKPNTTEDMGGTPLLKYIKARLEKI
ncbi:MAG: molybdopterin-dependent oxidoreductase [Deltaproteobacteria bacterium]|nr:molybdopterin-dependent oxidoreductase [Deltaproteobacteria bacterium]